MEVDNVTLERKLGDIVPDVILDIDGQQLMVEIAVTHFIDEVKGEKIRELDVSTIEIDLSKLVKEKIELNKGV